MASGQTYKVRPGECMGSIAWAQGFDWQVLWDLPENKALRDLRKNPNVLLHGDEVFIPAAKPKQLSATTGQSHRFQLKIGPTITFRLTDRGQPRATQAFTLVLDDGVTRDGKTDGSGLVTLAVPPHAKTAKLRIQTDLGLEVYSLQLGYLDPVSELQGVQQRLFNLGYGCRVTGELDEEAEFALKAFQEQHGLSVSGQPDQATLAKLVQVHGA